MNLNEQVEQALAQQRREKGFTPIQVAEAANLAQAYISEIEQGIAANTDIETLKRSAHAHGTTLIQQIAEEFADLVIVV